MPEALQNDRHSLQLANLCYSVSLCFPGERINALNLGTTPLYTWHRDSLDRRQGQLTGPCNIISSPLFCGGQPDAGWVAHSNGGDGTGDSVVNEPRRRNAIDRRPV